MPALYGLSNDRIAYLSSINQITIASLSNPENSIKQSLEIEPSIIGLYDNNLAFGMNNKIQFNSVDKESTASDIVRKVY